MKNVENKRIYLYDNIKGILIFFVVLGHMIEYIAGGPFYKTLYILIYSFHMPLFIYVSGYFANANPKKTVKNVLYPYVVFQCLYVIFDRLVLKGTSATISLVAPYWLLWYLPALAIWRSLLPFFETNKKSKAISLLAGAFLISLIAGFDEKLSYYLAFSRVAVFFFFFLLAYYQRKFIPFEKLLELKKKKWLKVTVALIALVFVSVGIIFNQSIKNAWFQGAYAYSILEYNVFIRLAIMLCALAFIALFHLFVTNKKIPLLSYVGQNSIFVFLLHGFVVKLVDKFEIHKLLNCNFLLIVLLSVLIVALFANKYTVKILKPLVQFPERRIKNGNNSCNEQ